MPPKPPEWRSIKLTRLCKVLERGKLTWWNCPRTQQPVLRSKVATYEFKSRPPYGYFIRRRVEFWNN